LLACLSPVTAQPDPYPADLKVSGFIRNDLNRFEGIRENKAYQILFARFDTLIRTGQNQIRIVHLGGSHIQADIYTHRIRQQLQAFYPGISGARGFIFPNALTHTNTPSNLSISYTGKWHTARSVKPDPDLQLGLSGFVAELVDSSASLLVVARYDSLHNYDFNRVKIFCNTAVPGNEIELLPEDLVDTVLINDKCGYKQLNLKSYTDTLRLRFCNRDTSKIPFRLYGLSLENNDPGVIYDAIGVNGAKLSSYLGCQLFVPHLMALAPEWIIISIGTNDGNTRDFDAEAYRRDYDLLLQEIRYAAPEAAILLTVPNDSYILKRYTNRNTEKIRSVIVDLAAQYGCGVWDFYAVMGGLNSAAVWYDNGLMNRDHVHFNKAGYLLKGDLFFEAFIRSWEEHLNSR
jgi:lysophospholipase L1-like esterase